MCNSTSWFTYVIQVTKSYLPELMDERMTPMVKRLKQLFQKQTIYNSVTNEIFSGDLDKVNNSNFVINSNLNTKI